MLHPYPDILSLGILLLEIELGIDIEPSGDPDYATGDDDEDSDIAMRQSAALEMLDDSSGFLGLFSQAIIACLLGDSLTTYEADAEIYLNSLLDEIYGQTVKPLEDDLYAKLGISTNELHDFRLIL